MPNENFEINWETINKNRMNAKQLVKASHEVTGDIVGGEYIQRDEDNSPR